MDKNGPEIKIDNGELATSMIPEDFTEPQVLYEKLIKMIRQYHPSDDISMIEKAYRIAYKAHDGQLRKSGEPYIIHPVCVCIILAELELDKETIVAGMLHDVVEDTVMTSEELAAEFGDEVALLVYSISWGLLMATVSAVTVSGVPRAATGISKVELPSVLVGRYFSPSTIM